LLAIGCTTRLLGLGDYSQIVSEAGTDAHDPEMQFGFFYMMAAAWVFVWPVFGLPCLVLSFVLYELHLVGANVAIWVFAFGGGFCLGGTLDALWRAIVIREARSRYRNSNHRLDEVSRRLLRAAHANDWTTLVQIATGLFFAFHLWSSI
jgi:hypothetical protein